MLAVGRFTNWGCTTRNIRELGFMFTLLRKFSGAIIVLDQGQEVRSVSGVLFKAVHSVVHFRGIGIIVWASREFT